LEKRACEGLGWEFFVKKRSLEGEKKRNNTASLQKFRLKKIDDLGVKRI